jgi:hypothetical protein
MQRGMGSERERERMDGQTGKYDLPPQQGTLQLAHERPFEQRQRPVTIYVSGEDEEMRDGVHTWVTCHHEGNSPLSNERQTLQLLALNATCFSLQMCKGHAV